MTSFLFDTTILSILLDPQHKDHAAKKPAIDQLPRSAHRFVSVVALAELSFGASLVTKLGKGDLVKLTEVIRQASAYPLLEISRHTSAAYADLKAMVAIKYLARTLRKDRPKHIEEWIDKATGKALGVDENDLWMCAQAKERSLTFVTADGKMQRIADADPDLELLIL